MNDQVDMKFLVLLECSQEFIKESIMKSGEAGESKSNDDNLETLMKRFKTF